MLKDLLNFKKRFGEEEERVVTNPLGMEFVWIPPGKFLMGRSEEDVRAFLDKRSTSSLIRGKFEDLLARDCCPQHEVEITRGFWLGRCPVTVGQFRRFVEESGYITDAEREGFAELLRGEGVERKEGASWRDVGFDQDDRHPVVCVSWNDAMAMAEWLTRKEGIKYRLPTEAEWEYACRAGTQARYFFGDSDELLDKYVWYNGNSGDRTHPVGRKRPNPWGIYDMLGNVWEWCQDWYDKDYYAKSPRKDPVNTLGGSARVLRGDSWCGTDLFMDCAARMEGEPNLKGNIIGFRLLMENE